MWGVATTGARRLGAAAAASVATSSKYATISCVRQVRELIQEERYEPNGDFTVS
jgi:hypothetical protein